MIMIDVHLLVNYLQGPVQNSRCNWRKIRALFILLFSHCILHNRNILAWLETISCYIRSCSTYRPSHRILNKTTIKPDWQRNRSLLFSRRISWRGDWCYKNCQDVHCGAKGSRAFSNSPKTCSRKQYSARLVYRVGYRCCLAGQLLRFRPCYMVRCKPHLGIV